MLATGHPFVRARIVEMEVTTFMQQAEAAANEVHVETQPFRQSDGGRGNIRYIAGWAISKLIYLRKQISEENIVQ